MPSAWIYFVSNNKKQKELETVGSLVTLYVVLIKILDLVAAARTSLVSRKSLMDREWAFRM